MTLLLQRGIKSQQSCGGASALPNHHSTKPTTKQWRKSTVPKDTTLLLRLVVRRYRVGVLQSHDTTIININETNAKQNNQIIWWGRAKYNNQLVLGIDSNSEGGELWKMRPTRCGGRCAPSGKVFIQWKGKEERGFQDGGTHGRKHWGLCSRKTI